MCVKYEILINGSQYNLAHVEMLRISYINRQSVCLSYSICLLVHRIDTFLVLAMGMKTKTYIKDASFEIIMLLIYVYTCKMSSPLNTSDKSSAKI